MVEKINDSKLIKYIVLLAITLIACMPLFIPGIEGHFGQDLGFHLNRIEGIVTELKAGHFPVMMESNWMDGYGYPVAMFYGDVLLYIPALLRIIGVGIVASYKIYIILITLGTVCISYYCFKTIIGRVDIGLACSLIYTCAFYRIENVYIRGAVGEYSAMMFYPIVMLAMYYIYTAEKEIGWKKMFINASILTLGITGLINTHMLSTEIVGIVLIIFCVINFKKTFTRGVLLTYVMAGIEIVIVNLFYLVPFVDYFIHENVNITNTVGNARQIQSSGLHWWEYISFFKMPFANIDVAGDDRLLVTPGIICIAILIIGIIQWIRGKTSREMKITMVSVVVLLFIVSCYFPWNFLSSHTKLGDFLAQVQFPWRYVGIIVILLTLLGGRILEKIEKQNIVAVCYGAIVVLSLVTMVWFTCEYKTYGKLVNYATEEDLDSSDMGFVEYLRAGTTREDFTYTVSTTDNIIIEELDRNGTDRDYQVSNNTIGGDITFPIVNYRGYKVYDDNDNQYEIVDGDNNLIKIHIDNYNGKIHIRYVQPIYWVFAEIMSLVGLIAIIIVLLVIRRRKVEEI